MSDAGRILISGASGSGKSTLARQLARRHGRVIVFDPLDEYRRHAHSFSSYSTLSRLRARLVRSWAHGFRIAYVPPAGREPEYLHKLSLLLRACQAPYFAGKDRRTVMLLVEEMNLSFPVRELPRELYGFAELCSRGRHYGLELVGVTQRLAEVGTRFRGNTSETILFRQADHADVTAACRMLGPEWKHQVKALEVGQCLRFAGGQVNVHQVPADRRRRPANDNRRRRRKSA